MTHLSRDQVQELQQVFDAMDKVGAGLLDGDGLFHALRALGLQVPVTETGIESILLSVGRENDGFVDMDDFKAIVETLMYGDKSLDEPNIAGDDEDEDYKEEGDGDDDDDDDNDNDNDDVDVEEKEEEEDERMAVAFKSLSDQGFGGITLGSLTRAVEKQGLSDLEAQHLQEMVNEADTNHDGVVDWQEFRRIWKLSGL